MTKNPDLMDTLATLPGTAQQNLPAVIASPKWVPEKTVTFRGHNGRRMIVELPARRVGPDPFSDEFRESFASAFRTRDALLVWDFVTKAGIS